MVRKTEVRVPINAIIILYVGLFSNDLQVIAIRQTEAQKNPMNNTCCRLVVNFLLQLVDLIAKVPLLTDKG